MLTEEDWAAISMVFQEGIFVPGICKVFEERTVVPRENDE